MNKRYQKDTKVGSTRKSASSAKPKRSSASPTPSSSKPRSSSSSRYQPVVLPPEIKRLQKISFALLGVAVFISAMYLWKGKEFGSNGSLLLGVAYGCMFTALYIDFARVRPAQKAARNAQAGGKQASPAKSGTASTSGGASASKTAGILGFFGRKQTSKPAAEASSGKSDKLDTSDAEKSGDEGN